jgi:4-hydroxy-2-oxoheptanedioate aldolase
MIENTILKKIREGRRALVVGLSFPSTEAIELAARVGFDAVNLDGEHGAFAPDAVDLLVRVAHGYGMSVIARVPSIDPWLINHWLDRGVQGILGPHIESGEEAQQLADACLFPPDGRRSWGGGRGTLFNEDAAQDARHGGKQGFARWTNANMLVSGQIESKKGYDNLDAILAVPGLSAIAGGPNDLCASLGHPGEPNHPERQQMTAEINRRARAAGKYVYDELLAVMAIQPLLLASGRDFVKLHSEDRVGS